MSLLKTLSIHSVKWQLPALILLTVISFYPGLSGDFVFDDINNIKNNRSLVIDSFDLENLTNLSASGTSGPLKRPISLITFATNIYFTGMDAFPFKVTNLIIHLLNGILVYFLARALFSCLPVFERPEKPALIMAGIFLLHPLTLTSVLYIVQRMTSLAALFTLAGMLLYVIGRQQASQKKAIPLLIAAIFICTPLAALCKENGLLLPFYCLLIEIIFFRFKSPQQIQRWFLYGMFTLLVVVPVVYVTYKTLHHPGWIVGGYGGRSFTFTERVLTESRVLWLYLQMIYIPDVRLMGIFHDDIPISTSLFTPQSTFFSVIGLAILFVAAIVLSRRAPVFSFGVFFFFLGHSLESSIFPLDITHEHRNYLPMLGPLFIFVYYSAKLLKPLSVLNKYLLVSVLFFILGSSTAMRAYDWGDRYRLAIAEAKNHPGSILANHEAGRAVSELVASSKNDADRESTEKQALQFFYKAYELDISNANSLLTYIHASYLLGNPVKDLWYQQLYTLLNKKVLSATAFSEIASFTTCTIKRYCKPTPDQMNTIFSAALSNPRVGGKWKASLFISASRYFADQREFNKSIAAIYAAVGINDDFSTRHYLVYSLVKYGFVQQAKLEIDILKRKDYAPFYQNKIKQLERELNQKLQRFSHPGEKG